MPRHFNPHVQGQLPIHETSLLPTMFLMQGFVCVSSHVLRLMASLITLC